MQPGGRAGQGRDTANENENENGTATSEQVGLDLLSSLGRHGVGPSQLVTRKRKA